MNRSRSGTFAHGAHAVFTGIVQSVGVVRSIQRGSKGSRLALDAPGVPRPVADGASICVSGVCLTVTHSDPREIHFDVVPETLSTSTLGALTPGDKVNLEPSLRLGDPMDGHVVQGHVDGVARVVSVSTAGQEHVAVFEPPAALMLYIIPKGSIAIDGVSLTIASVDGATFSVALIPTTLAWTTLAELRPGRRVNIETDILARTIVTTMQRMQSTRQPLTVEALKENGW